MDINEYQRQTIRTAMYPEAGRCTEKELNYLVIGLVGEAGELANKYKKMLRHAYIELENYKTITMAPGQAEILADELGDVLWYMARICTTLGFSIEEVAQLNSDKLRNRLDAGEIKDHV